jgi:hypothetical protein
MTDHARPDDPILEPAMWHLYRSFFAQAERRRRWIVRIESFGAILHENRSIRHAGR